jgi:sugar O-acyltransferase (sialic acid O-acetyltransferase NeuD family)
MSGVGLIVVGGGGHGRVVADAALASGLQVVAFADTALQGGEIAGIRILSGDLPELLKASREMQAAVVMAVGDNAARQRIQTQLSEAGVTLARVVHPRASVLGRARLGEGVVLLAGSVVGVDAVVGDGAIVNTGATVDHDCVVGAFAHLSPGVHLGGQVRIGEGTHLAVGVSVRNAVSIGAWSVVGVGAAVVADIAERVVAFGVPAKVARRIGQ